MRAKILLKIVVIGFALTTLAQEATHLPQTSTLTNTGDLSAEMVAGIDHWLMRETESAATNRAKFWQRDLSSREAYGKSVAPNRERLRRLIGAVDELAPARKFEVFEELSELKSTTNAGAVRVRWPVFENVWGEGLLLRPNGAAGAERVAIVLPDADQSPEMLAGLVPSVPPQSQIGRHLVAAGYHVLIPAPVSRSDEFSGNAKLKRFTNQSHREWIYRQSYELGRHIIGYEVQQVLAAVSCAQTNFANRTGKLPTIGIVGYGEGGLIALYAAALDARIDATLVSGYFGEREQLWSEPIYRNVFGLLREFGDAEIASLIAPRRLIVEYSKAPPVDPRSGAAVSAATRPLAVPAGGRTGAAPGKSVTPEFAAVEGEVDRANTLVTKLPGGPFATVINGAEGTTVDFGSPKALSSFAAGMGDKRGVRLVESVANNAGAVSTAVDRQRAIVSQWERFTQDVIVDAERERDARMASQLKSTNAFLAMSKTNREFFWRDVIGKIDAPKVPPNPRTRKIYDEPKWTGYDVMLDVVPDVYAWGVLLVPKDLKPGERRPVVVCQHGLEGVPADTITGDLNSQAWKFYKGFAAKLAERGFIVYAPHNPYRGKDAFRVLQRKANPLGLSLFSFIIAQHEVATDWLASLSFVDPQRIAFYGLSYGGKTAMRVPAVVERYCLSICSGDFNEWVLKNTTTESPYSYMFTGEYEMPEWDLGHTFNYAEMASLIVPRPFMVERGHDDGVAPDEWVAYEYAKVRRMYDRLGIGDRTEIEFFNGPHTINGVGTFHFLHKHLNWPEPK